MTHWTEEFFVENPDLFVDALEDRDENAGQEVEVILDLLDRRFDHRPESVLDAACGLGYHVREFAARGIDAAGFDISGRYVETAREHLHDADLDGSASVFRDDLRTVGDREDTYDLVTCLWNSFGYFDEETNRQVLDGLKSRLAPGGVLVMDVANRDAILANLQTERVIEDDSRLIAEIWEYDVPTSRYTVDRHVFDRADDELRHRGSGGWDVRAFSPPEIEAWCLDAGFDRVETFGDFEGGDPSLESKLVVVAG